MPDLDQIKQGDQVARDRRGRFPNAGRAIPSAGRAAAATTSTAPPGLLLAGEGDALTRKSLRAGTRQRSGGITAVPRTHHRDAPTSSRRITLPRTRGEGSPGELSACQSVDFRVFRKPAELFLRKDELSVDGDFEHARHAFDELDFFCTALHESGLRTEGPRFIVSRHAVFDPDLH
jgi:hypothetical protein